MNADDDRQAAVRRLHDALGEVLALGVAQLPLIGQQAVIDALGSGEAQARFVITSASIECDLLVGKSGRRKVPLFAIEAETHARAVH